MATCTNTRDDTHEIQKEEEEEEEEERKGIA